MHAALLFPVGTNKSAYKINSFSWVVLEENTVLPLIKLLVQTAENVLQTGCRVAKQAHIVCDSVSECKTVDTFGRKLWCPPFQIVLHQRMLCMLCKSPAETPSSPSTQPAAPLPLGSQCCRGSSTGRVWPPWAGREAPCGHPAGTRRPRWGSGLLRRGGVTGWSSADGRPWGSTVWCSNPGPLRK